MYNQRKKLPFFIGMGMILAGIVTMVISNSVGENVRPYIVFGGVMVFIAGFAATVLYATLKDSVGKGEKKEKKPLTKAKKKLILSGVVCGVGFLALLAGFILFKDGTNYLLVIPGMIVFLAGGSSAINVFQKNVSEFVPKEDDDAEGDDNGDTH